MGGGCWSKKAGDSRGLPLLHHSVLSVSVIVSPGFGVDDSFPCPIYWETLLGNNAPHKGEYRDFDIPYPHLGKGDDK